MGAYNTKWSTPPYLNEYYTGDGGAGGDSMFYDSYGYRPSELTNPSFKAYTTYFTHGGPAVNYKSPKTNWPDWEINQMRYGIVNSHLAAWGAQQPFVANVPKWPNGSPRTLLDQNDIGVNAGGSVQSASNIYTTFEWTQAMYPDRKSWEGVYDNPPQGWITKYAGQRSNPTATGICNPLNYPNCNMSQVSREAPTVKLYDKNEALFGQNEWREAIQRAYDQSYVNGGFDGLDKVNSTDTSTSDPCEGPGYLVNMGNAMLAAGGLALYTFLIDPELTGLLSNEQRLALAVGTTLGVFFWARSASDDFGDPETNAMYAENMLGIPIGWALVDYANKRYEFGMPSPLPLLGGAALSYFLLAPGVGVILYYTGFLRDIWGLAMMLASFVEGFICRIVSGPYDACTDFATFPDARRWNAIDIAGKLTDEIRSDEGWDRNDPRAEYVFKAMLTSPAIMDLARIGGPNEFSLYDKEPVNPLGAIYAPDDIQQDNPGGMLYNYGLIGGWDGGRSDMLDVGNNNYFGCQNWERMRTGDLDSQGGEKDKLNPTKTANVEARQVSNYFDLWVKKLKNDANDPNNLDRAKRILGWNKDITNQPWKNNPSYEEIVAQYQIIHNAKTAQERFKACENYFATYNTPSRDEAQWWQAINTFFTDNYTFYEVISSTESTAEEWWDNFFSKYDKDNYASELEMFHILQHIGSSAPNTDVRAYWMKAPKAMYDAANVAEFMKWGMKDPFQAGFDWVYTKDPGKQPPTYGPPPNPNGDPLLQDAIDMLWKVNTLTERGEVGGDLPQPCVLPASGEQPSLLCFLWWNQSVFKTWKTMPGTGLKTWYDTIPEKDRNWVSFAIYAPPWNKNQLAEFAQWEAFCLKNGIPEPSGLEPDTWIPANWQKLIIEQPDPLNPPNQSGPYAPLPDPHPIHKGPLKPLQPPNTIGPIAPLPDPEPILTGPFQPIGPPPVLTGPFKGLQPPPPLLAPFKGLNPPPGKGPFQPLRIPPSSSISQLALNQAESLSERAAVCAADQHKCDNPGLELDGEACWNYVNAMFWKDFPDDESQWTEWTGNLIFRMHPQGYTVKALAQLGWAVFGPPYNPKQLQQYTAWRNWVKNVNYPQQAFPPNEAPYNNWDDDPISWTIPANWAPFRMLDWV